VPVPLNVPFRRSRISTLSISFLGLYRQHRFFSGVSTAVLSGFLVYTFLEPLFVPVGSDAAMVFLHILAINGALVGLSLGVLLPTLFSGACLGASLALLAGSFMVISNPLFFPSVAGALVVILGTLSVR
jgi:callose synthase